jgi:ribosome-binding protein aMBF1 (putative translation factor)
MFKIGAEEIRKAGHRQHVRELKEAEEARLQERVRDALEEHEQRRVRMGIERGRDVLRLRVKAGLSRRELSLLAGVSISQLGKIERGDAEPFRQTLQALAAGLEFAGTRVG